MTDNKPEMIKGKTASGFEFEFEADTLDDYELLEALIKVDKGDYTMLPAVVDSLFRDRKQALMDHLRQDNGRVSVKAIAEAMKEIFTALNENKQSKN